MLDDKKLTDAISALHPQKKGFSQSYDLIIAFKELNLKDPKDQVEFFAPVPHGVGRKRTVCALVGPEMIDDAKASVDFALQQADFEKLGKKDLRKIAAKYDFFVGQANIMPKIAAAFGRALGPRGKMPNPKAGCIVPPKAPLKPLVERLQKTIKVSIKKAPTAQLLIGSQAMSPGQIADNARSLYDQLTHNLPKEEQNIKAVYLKLTMSEPIRLR